MARDTKPDCADFIVEAIRTIRGGRHNMASGTALAVYLDKLSQLAYQVYTEQEFYQGLKKAMRADTVVVVATSEPFSVVKEGNELRRRSIGSISKTVQVRMLPSNPPSTYSGWELNEKGKPVAADGAVGSYVGFYNPRAYVKQDGIPQSVLDALKGKTATARDIVAQMKRSKPAKKPAKPRKKA